MKFKNVSFNQLGHVESTKRTCRSSAFFIVIDIHGSLRLIPLLSWPASSKYRIASVIEVDILM